MEHFLKIGESYISLVEVTSVEARVGQGSRLLSVMYSSVGAFCSAAWFYKHDNSLIIIGTVCLLASWFVPDIKAPEHSVVVTLSSGEQWCIPRKDRAEAETTAWMIRGKVKEARRSNPVNVFQDNRSVTVVGNGRLQ